MFEDKNIGQSAYDLGGVFSLMRELQESLYKIARSAELNDPELLADIQQEAEIALKFIDSYLYSAKLESGQISLELSPVGLGSLLHETAYEVRAVSGSDVGIYANAKMPAMANQRLLKNFLFSVGYFISKSTAGELRFTSFKEKDNRLGVGVLAKNFDLSSSDLRLALSNRFSHMPMAKQSEQSPIMLIVADVTARALGGQLFVKKLGNNKGLSLSLGRSEQTAFI
jgi:hypothetical protein